MNGCDISILMPSFQRPELLLKSIASFAEHASGKHAYEVLVLADSEDLDTIAAVTNVLTVHLVVQKKLRCFRNIHRFMNVLAAVSDGDFLWTLNDDGRVITPMWDVEMFKVCPNPRTSPAYLIVRSKNHGGARDFPILTRAWYDAIGRISPCAHSDCYLERLADCAGARIDTRIEMHHAQFERAQNPENRDVMETWNLYRSEANCQNFEYDLDRLSLVLRRPVQRWSPKQSPIHP